MSASFDEVDEAQDAKGEDEQSCDQKQAEVALNGGNQSKDKRRRTDQPPRKEERGLDAKCQRLPMEGPTHPMSRGNFAPKSGGIIKSP
jgi:hypothetical protein